MTGKESQPSSAPRRPGASAPAARRSASDFELRCLRRLWALNIQLKGSRNISSVVRAVLRAAMELLDASEGCVVALTAGQAHAEIDFSMPRDAAWDRAFLTCFIRGGEGAVPADIALGRLRRRGRMWGALAVRATGVRFGWDEREAVSSLASLANECLERIDQERTREVRARIDCKILEQLRPKDLWYQVLHGLHSLTQYDHSASFWIYDHEAGTLEVAAETITWKKGKSDKIGQKLALSDSCLALLRPGVVYGFDRPDRVWEEWTGAGAVGLADFLDLNVGSTDPLDRSMLCAPLATREGILGLLKVAALHSGAFGPYHADMVGQFLPHVAIGLQNLQRAASLERNLLQAERKHAMAELSRGVAHDVNNALGAVLPLVQQMQAELVTGPPEPAALADDLRQIERSIQVSRRIFGGMLSFARGSARVTAGASIAQALRTTRALLNERFRRSGVELIASIEPALPTLPAAQSDLEQLFLNLLTNAREATPPGGRVTLSARRHGDALHIVVEDTGAGIPPENLAKIFEPFFSTKPQGNGLGLSICRSIVWQMHGTLEVTSAPGQGTQATIVVPLAPPGVA
jgi:signal transduction histidine kinase